VSTSKTGKATPFANTNFFAEPPRIKTRWQEIAESYFSVVLKLEPAVFDPLEDQHLIRLARLKQALEVHLFLPFGHKSDPHRRSIYRPGKGITFPTKRTTFYWR